MKATVQAEPRTTKESRPEGHYVAPEVNIYQTKDGYVLEAEMPGVSKEGLEITLEGNEITFTGQRKEQALPGTPLIRERGLADYRRVFELDPAIDTARISAKMERGLLLLTLPKSEKVKPRRITVS